MTDEISRRSVLGAASAVFGTGSVSNLWAQDPDTSRRGITGWVTQGSPSDVSGQKGVVETFRYSGSSLCNDGSVYRCRTCAGAEFYLLVPTNGPQPTAEITYRFVPTGETNVCRNFQVTLFDADPCETATSATADATAAEAPPPTETTTTATETTEETTTEETPTDTTTEEPTTDTATDTTTEEPSTEDAPADDASTEETATEGSARSEE